MFTQQVLCGTATSACRPHQFVFPVVLAMAFSGTAYAQQQQMIPTGVMEEVIAVGSRSLTERAATDSMVPVDAFNAESLRDTGQIETSRMLQFVSPSFNFSTSTISDGTDILRPATLRGLNPDQTLVLVNGKRRHTAALMHVNGSIGRGAAGVDLNAIPAAAIKRIEVLRDGASALYGSDAIAGVLNIVMKDQDETIDPNFYIGQTFDDDGEQKNVSMNAGFPVFGGFINLTGEYRDRDATNRAGVDPNQLYNYTQQVAQQPQIDDSLLPGDPGFVCTAPGSGIAPECALDSRELTAKRVNHRYGDPDSENYYFSWNAGIPVPLFTDSEFYTFGGIARRDGESGGFYRRASNSRTNLSIHPDGFLPLISTDVDDDSVVAGLQGQIGEWNYDTSLTYGKNEFDFTIKNSNNVSLGDTSPTKADAGGLQIEQTVFNLDFVRQMDLFGLEATNVAAGFQWLRDTYEINAGDYASWANGVNDDDNPATVPDPCVSPDTDLSTFVTNTPACNQYGGTGAAGIQVFPGFRPSNSVDEDRDSFAFYLDLEKEFTDRWLAGAAIRYEDYDDFGTSVTGKLASRYRVTDEFNLRGAVSTGFRAPSMQQQYFNNVSTQFVGVPTMPVEVATFNTDSPVLGPSGFNVGSLDEEKSVNVSAGFAWTPRDNITVTTDFYYISIDDRIVLSGRFQAESDDGAGNPCVPGALPGDPGYCPIRDILAPFPGVSSGQFFSNAIDTETWGVDFFANWATEFNHGGVLNVSAAMNYNDTSLDGDVDVPSTLSNAIGEQAAADTLFSRQEIIWLEDGQPEDHYVLSSNYTFNDLTIAVTANMFGEVKSTESSSSSCVSAGNCADQDFDDKWLVDVVLNYRITDDIRLAVGANNIFDEKPDKTEFGSNSGIFPYNRRTTPFGFNGGFYYASLSMSFAHGL